MKVADIKKGMTFAEHCGMSSIVLKGIEDATHVGADSMNFTEGWTAKGEVLGGDGEVGQIITFFSADIAPAYAPDLLLLDQEVAQ